MQQILIIFLNASIILLAFITFIEVIISFKRPLLLKIIILLILFVIAVRCFGEIYCFYNGYNRWLIELANPILFSCTISLFSFIFQSKISKYVLLYSITIILVNLFIHTYYTFIDPISAGFKLIEVPRLRKHLLLIRYGFLFIGLFLNIKIMLSIIKKFNAQNIYFVKLKLWALLFLTNVIIVLIGFAIRNMTTHYNLDSQLIICFSFIMQVLLFLFRPKFLNRTNLKIILSDLFVRKQNDHLNINTFTELFFTNVYYINKEASAEDLRTKLNVTAEVLNNFIYTTYGVGLTDLVNKYRINYFIDLVNTGKYGNYTIDALAQEAGFNSRFHLYKSFKKYHGGTPSDFIRSVVD